MQGKSRQIYRRDYRKIGYQTTYLPRFLYIFILPNAY